MDPSSAVGLGVLQGLTEFLPVSSSGHLSLMQYFLGLEEVPRFFDVMLHVGTLAAVLLWCRRPIAVQAAVMRRHWRRGTWRTAPSVRRNLRFLGFLVLATLPAVVVGLGYRPTQLRAGEKLADHPRPLTERIGNLREYSAAKPRRVLLTMFATGAILLAASAFRDGRIGPDQMRWWHVLLIGCAQAISAVLPGLSRAGMTISAALLLGLRGRWAVLFSLGMSVPAILGAAVLKGREVPLSWLTPANLAATLVAAVVAAAVGWFCITLLMGAVTRHRWWWFTVYLWTLVALLLATVPLPA